MGKGLDWPSGRSIGLLASVINDTVRSETYCKWRRTRSCVLNFTTLSLCYLKQWLPTVSRTKNSSENVLTPIMPCFYFPVDVEMGFQPNLKFRDFPPPTPPLQRSTVPINPRFPDPWIMSARVFCSGVRALRTYSAVRFQCRPSFKLLSRRMLSTTPRMLAGNSIPRLRNLGIDCVIVKRFTEQHEWISIDDEQIGNTFPPSEKQRIYGSIRYCRHHRVCCGYAGWCCFRWITSGGLVH